MALKSDKNLKLYYSIREVAEMFDVNESLLRYWEKEFPIIAPKKAGGNIRQYTKEDSPGISSCKRKENDSCRSQTAFEAE